MLEIQKDRFYQRSRLRAKGASEEEIAQAQAASRLPFRPAFENGKRRNRSTGNLDVDHEVPTEQFAFRRQH